MCLRQDFGVKAADTSVRVRVHIVMLTPHFTSPPQAEKEAKETKKQKKKEKKRKEKKEKKKRKRDRDSSSESDPELGEKPIV